MNKGIEEWRDIKGYEGLYQISDCGRVKSLGGGKTHKSGCVMKPNKDNYCSINLCKNGVKKRWLVHRLVYEAFNGEIPDGIQVNHIDEDKHNNSLNNLNLMTPKENINWGTHNERSAITRGKKVIQINKTNNEIIAEYNSACEASRTTGVNQQHISSVCRNEKGRKTAGGFI